MGTSESYEWPQGTVDAFVEAYGDDDFGLPTDQDYINWNEANEYHAEAEMAYYDDDPNPYHGDYSEM